MTSVELVRSTALAEAIPYAYAAVTPPGQLVFTAGACPLDLDGAVVSPGDVAAQARQAVCAAFGDHDPPSTLLGVAVLGYPGQLVEVEAVAVTDGAAS
jgi:enamine deaminase RidA (YjgF/YER057c/UK114 family)